MTSVNEICGAYVGGGFTGGGLTYVYVNARAGRGLQNNCSNLNATGTHNSSPDSYRDITHHSGTNLNGRVGVYSAESENPVTGRFLSPDPVLQDPANAQNYNKYSYVLNNPLKYTDPSGNISEEWSYWQRANLLNMQSNSWSRYFRNTGISQDMIDVCMEYKYASLYSFAFSSDGGGAGGSESTAASAPAGGNCTSSSSSEGGGGCGVNDGDDEITSDVLRKVFFKSFIEYYSKINKQVFDFSTINELGDFLVSFASLEIDPAYSNEYPELSGAVATINFFRIDAIGDNDATFVQYKIGELVCGRSVSFTDPITGNTISNCHEEYPYFSYNSSGGATGVYAFRLAFCTNSGMTCAVNFQWQLSLGYSYLP